MMESQAMPGRAMPEQAMQDQALQGRADLDARVQAQTERFEDGAVPRPPTWGGYRLLPDYWEFWQGRPSRLHDRLSYRLQAGQWQLARLAP